MFTRNFTLILLANIILGSAMPILIITGGLAGAQLAPSPFLATLPPSIQMLSGILVAAPISLFMGRFGRKAGFLLGANLLVSGGLMGAVALVKGWFVILCLAHFLMGAALIAVNYFRFAAAESVPAERKASAISLTLASGIVAAYVGPAVFSFSNDYFAPVSFAGAYLAICVLAIIGAIPVLFLSGVLEQRGGAKSKHTGDTWHVIARRPDVALAICAAALSQAIMVLLMTPTPLAMVACGFEQGQAADVIRWHVIAMFAPGFVTGPLIRRFGAGKIIAAGLLTLGASAMVALGGTGLGYFYISLVLLGVGWNFGFIGGTHMLQSVLSEQERPIVQGVNDTFLAIASFCASLLSGVLFAGIGWGAILAGALPLLAIASLGFWGLTHRIGQIDRV